MTAIALNTKSDERDERLWTEIRLIGALLIWNNPLAIRLSQGICGPEHFSEPMMARMFHLISEGLKEGHVAFALTHYVATKMRDDEVLLHDGGFTPSSLIAHCCANACVLITVEAHARSIRRAWIEDQIQLAINDHNMSLVTKLAEEVGRYSSATQRDGEAIESMGTITKRTIDSLNDAFQAGGTETDFAACGLTDLAHAIGGWRRKRFYIIAGRPGMGKSTFALASLLRTAQAGHGVMMFALEMGRQELSEMALCDLAWAAGERIEYRDISVSAVMKDGFKEKFEAVLQVAPMLNSMPFFIGDRGGLTVAEVRAQAMAYAERLKADEKRLEVICIDHLGLLKPTGNYRGNKVAETEEVSADLKILAKDMDCAVVALCQLSRQVEQRDDKRPNLSDLRWSGGIEQDADCVMFVYREEYYLKKKEVIVDKEEKRQERLAACRNKLEVLIEKQRGGPTTALEFFCNIGSAVVRDAVHHG